MVLERREKIDITARIQAFFKFMLKSVLWKSYTFCCYSAVKSNNTHKLNYV